MSPVDAKEEGRVVDPDLLAALHREWYECFICSAINVRLSLHHVHKHPRSDLRENLVLLCGDGVSGCHGDVEHARGTKRADLARRLRISRPDVFGYLSRRLGSSIAADEWLRRYAEGKT